MVHVHVNSHFKYSIFWNLSLIHSILVLNAVKSSFFNIIQLCAFMFFLNVSSRPPAENNKCLPQTNKQLLYTHRLLVKITFWVLVSFSKLNVRKNMKNEIHHNLFPSLTASDTLQQSSDECCVHGSVFNILGNSSQLCFKC